MEVKIPAVMATCVCLSFLIATVADAQKVLTSPGGVKIQIVREGKGPVPRRGQNVVVHYIGALTNGKQFDSSRDRGRPFTFHVGMGEVITGWDEAVGMLKIGTRAILTIPPNLGYGPSGAGRGVIPPNATLIFDVELLDAK